MALAADWYIQEDDVLGTCEVVAEAGMGLVVDTVGSGSAMGDTGGQYTMIANPSGKVFVGVLLNDVVNVDLTKFHLNYQKRETNIGDPCWVMRKGWIVTDQVTGSPTKGDTAYLTTSGVFTPTVSSTGGTVATPKAGKFEGAVDENGFAKISFNLPIV